MSTTARRPFTAPPSEDVEPEDVFDEYIWDNPEVCNECFARPVEVEVPTEDAPDAVSDLRHWDGEDGDLDTIPEDLDAYGANVLDRPMTVCKHCGSTSLAAYSDTLSQRQALSRIPTLADRLREQGVEVNQDLLAKVVWRGKKRESLVGYDREIFELAVKKGVEYARCR